VRLRSLRKLLLGALILSMAAPAWAAPSDADRATARELGTTGLAALDAKDYPTAVERFSRAIALYDAATLRLGRARALRAMGRFVSASEDYRAILLRTPSASDPPAIVQATRDATRELPDVEASIAHLTVVLSGAPGALRVDGVEWPSVTIGVPRPLDPGEHLVEAFTSSLQVQSQRVTLTAGQSARIEIPLLAPPAEPPSTAGQVGAQPPLVSVDSAGGSGVPAPAPPPSADHTAAIVTAAISGALVAGAVVTGIMAMSKKSDFDKQNRPDVPHATKDDLRSQASTLALVSTVLTGLAVVGGGITIYLFVAPSRSEAAGPRTAQSLNAGFVFSQQF
jgi:tetratricopeptide (TPR) repeat protein